MGTAVSHIIPTNATPGERQGYAWADGIALYVLRGLQICNFAEIALELGAPAGFVDGAVVNRTLRELLDEADNGDSERAAQVAKCRAERAHRAELSRLAGVLLAVRDAKEDAEYADHDWRPTCAEYYEDPAWAEAQAQACRDSSAAFTARLFDLPV